MLAVLMLIRRRAYKEVRSAKRFSGHAAWLVAFGLTAAQSACQDEYPLPPTFCDDWCHSTLRADCGQQPDDCVRACELTRASHDCIEKQSRLMHCYEDSPDSDFVCAGTGFDSEERVAPDRCQKPRDELYECESPGITVCLTLCRQAQDDQLGKVVDSETGLVDYRKLLSDAGVPSACPVLDQPCENLCWGIYGFSSDGLIAAGILPDEEGKPANANVVKAIAESKDTAGVHAPDAGVAGETTPTGVLQCVQLELLSCLLDSTGAPDAPGSTPPAADAGIQRLRSIAEIVGECGASKSTSK